MTRKPFKVSYLTNEGKHIYYMLRGVGNTHSEAWMKTVNAYGLNDNAPDYWWRGNY